jgi:hypothetical protein
MNCSGGEMKAVVFAAVLIALGVFIMTVPPTIYLGDSGEIAAAAYTLGICHPPGYPVFMLMEKIFSFIPAGDIAFRMNLLSSVLAAFLLFVFYITAAYALENMFQEENPAFCRLAALAVSCAFVFSKLFWFEAVNIKGGIYVLEYLAVLAAVLFALKFYYEKSVKYFYAAVYLAGFLPVIHHTSGLAMVFIITGCIAAAGAKKSRVIPAAAALFALGFFTPYLYLYLRAGVAGVAWADISGRHDIFRHITRFVYMAQESPPFTMGAAVFKTRNYLMEFLGSYNIICLPVIFGIYRMYNSARRHFNILAAFFLLNFAGIIIFTSNDPSPMYVYTNRTFYLLNDLVLFMFAAYGIAAATGFIEERKIKITAAACAMIVPSIFIASNYQACDLSGNFLAYDHAMNICKTLEPDGIFFEKSDEIVFGLQYLKYVKKFFPGLGLYDSNGNVLDVSYFKGIRTEEGFTREAQQALELKMYEKNTARTFYYEGTGFPVKHLLNRRYGMLYRLMDENMYLKNSENLMQICSLRGLLGAQKGDLINRDVGAKYLTIMAEYRAMAGDNAGFKIFADAADLKAGDYSNVHKALAYVYYLIYRDGQDCMNHLEKCMEFEPYDFAMVNLIISLYGEMKAPGKELEWLKYYYAREWHPGIRKNILDRINALEKKG